MPSYERTLPAFCTLCTVEWEFFEKSVFANMVAFWPVGKDEK